MSKHDVSVSDVRLIFESYTNRVAIKSDGVFYSYYDLLRDVDCKYSMMLSIGAPKGSVVAVDMKNSFDFVSYYMLCAFYGYCICPINSLLSDDEKNYIVKDCNPNVYVSDDKIVYRHGGVSALKDVYLICYTSGTTSRPKGVCHSFESLVNNVIEFNSYSGIDGNVVMYHVLPMGYMAGFLNTLLSPLIAGGTVVLGDQFSAKSIGRFWESCIENECNSAWLTPTILSYLNKMTRNSFFIQNARSKLRSVFVGTAPLLSSLKDDFQSKFGILCVESYGMTEILLVSANIDFVEGSVGKALEHISIFNEYDSGCNFVLKVKTKNMFLGYYSSGVVEYPALESGYFNTGDICTVKKDGFIFITGREKDLVIKGGKNISCRMIEESISGFVGVIDLAVVGFPHDFWGEDIALFIVVDENFNEDSFKLFCGSVLKKEHLPSRIITLDVLPKSSIGKIKKTELRRYLA